MHIIWLNDYFTKKLFIIPKRVHLVSAGLSDICMWFAFSCCLYLQQISPGTFFVWASNQILLSCLWLSVLLYGRYLWVLRLPCNQFIRLSLDLTTCDLFMLKLEPMLEFWVLELVLCCNLVYLSCMFVHKQSKESFQLVMFLSFFFPYEKSVF